jgi:RNA polymerase sigma factor (sigma-70 family)
MAVIPSITALALAENADSHLVAQSQTGSREAFGQIVARYQSLVCSLAYSATGSLSRSEDLAQETFLIAWRQLATLRDPQRLRSWLCGIARNLINSSLREQRREPVHGADSLASLPDSPSAEPLPSEHAISREEEALLWRTLDRIPTLYREPLVLFYREHHSVAEAATALDLSEDAVKQRLVRGRKLLQQEMIAFVESALERTKPGKAFTLGVLASLPLLAASSATAATVGATGAKVGTGSTAAASVGLIWAVLGPLIGLLGAFWGARASIINTRSPRERQFMIRQTVIMGTYVLIFIAALFSLILFGQSLVASSPAAFGGALGALVVSYCLGLFALITRANRRQRQIRIEDGTTDMASPHPPQPVTRKQQLWTVYGSLGGGTLGSLAWMIIQSVQAGDWFTALLTVAVGTAVVLFGGRTWMRCPERRLHVMAQTLALVGLYIVAMAITHWSDWTVSGRNGASATQAIVVGSGLTVVAIVMAVRSWSHQSKHLR